VVLDKLSTNTLGALYGTFELAEAPRLLRKLEFHSTPRHAKWLNMVESERGDVRKHCLDGGFGEPCRPEKEVTA
jgi:hypothetical protein